MWTPFESRPLSAAVAACLAVGILTSRATTAEAVNAQPADWQAYPLAENGAVKVRLEVKRRATPADQELLRLVFDNGGNVSVRITNAHYRIERQTLDLPTKRLTSTGSLASGNAYDLFPHAWATTPVSPILLQAGETYRNAAHPSEYAMALLGMPPAWGWRVEADAHLRLDLADGRELVTAPTGVRVVFEWHKPDEQGMTAVRARLKKLIAEPPTRVTGNYILSTLINEPTVAEVLTVDEVVAGLRGRTSRSIEGRDHLARFVNRVYRNDPKVIAYYLDALLNGNSAAADDLAFHAPDIWAETFLQPLLAMAAAKNRENLRTVLRALNNHVADWQSDVDITKRLSAAVLETHPLPTDDLELLDEPKRQALKSSLELLGMTRDRSAISKLRPLLDSTVVLFDPTDPRLSMPAHLSLNSAAPLRTCDAAAAAILQILGRDDAAAELLNVGPRLRRLGAPDPPVLRQDRKAQTVEQLAARDDRIAALRKELAKPLKNAR